MINLNTTLDAQKVPKQQPAWAREQGSPEQERASQTKLPELNDEQRAALEAIVGWLEAPQTANSPAVSPFFVLRGYAGTGKTFTMRHLVRMLRSGKLVFTAPTNKATKVLRDSFSDGEYKPECRTIYSLLGLQLAANGEVRELKEPEDPVDLTHYRCVIVDEGSMLNSMVMGFIKDAAQDFGVKFLFMGDPAQLPPVGESVSPIWKLPLTRTLEKVMRHDNQILTLATALRQIVDKPFATVNLQPNNDGEQGVWKLDARHFQAAICVAAHSGQLSEAQNTKIIAWRNVTVDKYNALARSVIFGANVDQFLPGDRIIFTKPAKDFSDELVATTDDEGTVDRVIVEQHPVLKDYRVFRCTITLDDNRVVVAYSLHPDSQRAFAGQLEELAQMARIAPRRWGEYWLFVESFHSIRHAYAITAHRAQGSTYTTALVDFKDILLNRTRTEAFRCLYVACTRPTTKLILGGGA